MHKRTLDDGSMTMEGGQQSQLFAELLENRGKSKLVGEARSSVDMAACAAGPAEKADAGSVEVKGETQIEEQEEEEDDEVEEQALDPLDMLLDFDQPAAPLPAGPGKAARHSMGRGSAKVKVIKTGKAKVGNMPSPLPGGSSARGGGAGKVKVSNVDSPAQSSECAKTVKDVEGILQKASGILTNFEQCTKLILAHDRDKNYFKNMAYIVKSLSEKEAFHDLAMTL